MQYDLIVVGGGPAGYVGAIRAAQLGKKVVCIERERVGGTCLNWGCIPTKSLLRNAEIFHLVNDRSAEFGLNVEGLSLNWSDVIDRSRKVSDRLSQGIGFLFKKNKIEQLTGEANLLGNGQVDVTDKDGNVTRVEADHILVCTGAQTRTVDSLPLNGRTIIGSREAMVLPEKPASMIIVGSGAIGSEFAYIYNSFGTQVTLIEALPRILPNEDDDSSQALERAFKKQGIKVLTGSAVQAIRETEDGKVVAQVATRKGEEEITADVCLVAIGVKPVIPGSCEFELTAKGCLKVDDNYQTSQPGIYAAGDVIGGVQLAHTASFEAIQAVEGMFIPDHEPKHVTNFPSCTYCHPQVASFGKTERALKEQGVEYKVGKFPLMAIGKAVADGETDGFVKLLFGKEYGEILGAHIVGENATELISGLGLAIQSELTDGDIHSTIFAHPTLSEALHEATLAADGAQIHA
jgi:dihydrolipoamide dehydrogenase